MRGSRAASLSEGGGWIVGACGRRKGSEAAERERCCSATVGVVGQPGYGASEQIKDGLSRSDIRFRMARSRKSVMVASGRYFRDSLKPVQIQISKAMRKGARETSEPFASSGMLSRCSSTICATTLHSLSLSASVLTSGTSVRFVKADEYRL